MAWELKKVKRLFLDDVRNEVELGVEEKTTPETNLGVALLSSLYSNQELLSSDNDENNDETINNAIEQLDEYLRGDRTNFNIPLLMVGTEFQKSVWSALLKVPYGLTSTYLQLAENVNNKKAVRAVASANGANAISLIIPCHRIIGSNGELVGYAGGLPVKKRLLELEQCDNEQYQFNWKS